MKSVLRILLAIVLCSPLGFAEADENEQSKATASLVFDDDELTEEAEAIVEELRSSLPRDSEALAMLNDILKGSHLSSDDGWFPLAKARSLFDWQYARSTYDADADGRIIRKEFSGSDQDFARLDRDGNGVLEATDLDYKQHSLTPTPGLQLFFMGDRDANGKLTREEFTGLFDAFSGPEGDFLSLDDLRDQLSPSTAEARDKRADRPSRSTLVKALKTQEIGSLQSGPQVGELAPDFTLEDLQGNKVKLSEQIGDKPIVLIFGNFTCGPFRSQAGNIEQLVNRYRDRAKFFLVYVREAHPEDGWWMMSNQRVGIKLAQPTTFRERKEVAMTCREHLNLAIPVLVDSLDDAVGSKFSGMPNRLYLIDQTGQIVFKNGRGPFGFHPRQLEQALIMLMLDEGSADGFLKNRKVEFKD